MRFSPSLLVSIVGLSTTLAFAQTEADVIVPPVPEGLATSMPRVPDQSVDRQAPIVPEDVALSAVLQQGAEPIEAGLQWHVFKRLGTRPGELVAVRRGGSQSLQLIPGPYVAHVTYGRASAISSFDIRANSAPVEPIVLDAGAIRLAAEAGGKPIENAAAVRFSIYETDDERKRLILSDVPSAQTILLAGGVYRVVVQYGTFNAAAGADIRVRPGEITEATLGVPGAEITLNLASSAEAAPLAAVAWRVYDADGKPLFESDRPSPTLILGEGTYTTEAVHDGKTIEQPFDVTAGEDKTVRVTIK